jgi:Tol biopolymer transport system component/tRNA A-37 threonylcarbamoyl transferase component Bud32
MTIASGTRLGPYEVLSLLGAGGMGEVYRAKDAKLAREVAVKVLPEDLLEGEERKQRFEREARLLAALNHPGIAAIYSFEEIPGSSPSSSRHILVMELAAGEGLDKKISAGPLPLEESLSIARQMAEALEAAHERGIVHRDLKPANVVVSDEGRVKLLDFGLAKAFENENGSSPEISHSPTLTARATAAGVILGTAAYMSPEQARGKPVDKRADVWAFGVVLFEMLTGKRLFQGETVSDTLAAVLRDPVDFGKLPPSTPPSVRVLLERCLERDPKQRLQAIGESRIALERTIAGSSGVRAGLLREAPPVARASRTALILPWALAAACAAAAGALALNARAPEARVYRAAINPPEGTVFVLDTTQPGPAVLSPDGRKLAFTARGADSKVRLYVRPLDSTEAQPLPGTEGAQYPFWSPDSRFIGFGADQKLKRIEAAGGPPSVLCAVTDFPKGGSWSPRGVIVFAPASGSPLHVVSENGGESKPVTTLDAKRGDNSHRLPFFLPDGIHFLFLARLANAQTAEGNQILVGSLDGGEPKPIVRSPAAAEYASGRLLFLRDRALMAQRFDPSRLTLEGEPHPLVENVSILTGAAKANFSASQAGVLVAQTGAAVVLGAQLDWTDAAGKSLGALVDRAAYDEVAISPDGRSVAVTAIDLKAGTHDVWICDVARNLKTRFTFEPGEELTPRWSPDGRSVVYVSSRGAQQGLYRKRVEGSGVEELLYTSESVKLPSGFSPDGKLLAFTELGADTSFDVWILPLTGDRKPYPFLKTGFAETGAVFSPDGKWLAYASNESGRFEVYVTPFPGPGRKWQVSAQGGGYPAWRQGGREILYQELQSNRIFSVPVAFRGDTPDFGKAAELFVATPPLAGIAARFDSTADGKRFIVIRPNQAREGGALTLVVNWPATLGGKT